MIHCDSNRDDEGRFNKDSRRNAGASLGSAPEVGAFRLANEHARQRGDTPVLRPI